MPMNMWDQQRPLEIDERKERVKKERFDFISHKVFMSRGFNTKRKLKFNSISLLVLLSENDLSEENLDKKFEEANWTFHMMLVIVSNAPITIIFFMCQKKQTKTYRTFIQKCCCDMSLSRFRDIFYLELSTN